MDRRICPGCGAVWYSADREGIWTCQKCGETIGAEDIRLKKGDEANE